MSGLVGFPEIWRSERGWLPLEIDDGLTEKSSPLGSRKPASRWSRKKAARGGASQENQNRTTSKAYISLMPKCAVFFPMYIYIYTYLDIGTIPSFLSYIIHAKSPHSWQEKGCTIPQPITVNLHGVQLLRSWRDSFHLQGLPKPSLAKVVRASNPFVSGCLLGGTSH